MMKKRLILGVFALIIAAVAGYFWREKRGGPTGPTPDEMVKLLLEFDQNADGKLTTDEVPERMQGLFERGDANKDGTLSQDELRKLAEADSQAAKRNEHEKRREGEWNGKFNGVGNGGLAGSISYGAMAQALARGYATASTDTGHTNQPGNESWPLGHPELIVDFASRGIHLTAHAAKSVIRAYYSQAPRYSYFTGCSGCGGQALSEAQRYPADYDGIVAGAPANFPTQMWPGELYAAYVTHRTPENLIPNEKLPMIAKAALAVCDAQDGLKDGLIADTRRCMFDPATIQCKGADSPDCLTAGQVDSVRKIYEGLKDPTTGKLFWPGFEPSSEMGWPGHIQNSIGAPPLGYFKYMAFNNPAWDWTTFNMADPKNFASLVEASNRLGNILNSTNPDLTAFQRLGGKMMMYHGWLDQNISPRNSISYYESVEEIFGSEARDFARLFMAPGMGHCGGGAGPNTLDGLAALESWVEKKQAPQQIVASHATNGKIDPTRPLCPYPQVAQYKGSGSIDDAANFVCQIQAKK